MFNITQSQFFLLIVVTLGVVSGATAQLNDLFGATAAHWIVTAASFAQTLLGAWLMVLTGQNTQIKSILDAPGGQAALAKTVADMPGVEPLKINTRATPALAALAVDKNVNKIGPSDDNVDELKAIAKSAA